MELYENGKIVFKNRKTYLESNMAKLHWMYQQQPSKFMTKTQWESVGPWDYSSDTGIDSAKAVAG